MTSPRRRAGGPLRPLLLLLLLTVMLSGCSDAVAPPTGAATSAAAATSQCSGCTPNSGSLDDPGAPSPGLMVDGIPCGGSEVLTYHVHSHLAIYINGTPITVPAGIGIGAPRDVEDGFISGGTCFMWLHTHDTTGLIHIEAPSALTFTLGNLFDVWGLPLTSGRVGPAIGPVTVYRNGTLWTGDPRSVTLGVHIVIQIDVGTRVAPVAYTFPAGV